MRPIVVRALTAALVLISLSGCLEDNKASTASGRTPAAIILSGKSHVTGEKPGLDGLTFDDVGNLYVTDAHEGMIWKVGSDGGAGNVWVKSPLLKPTRPPPATSISSSPASTPR